MRASVIENETQRKYSDDIIAATKITSTLTLPVADWSVGDKWGEVGRELDVGAKTPSAVRTREEGGQNWRRPVLGLEDL